MNSDSLLVTNQPVCTFEPSTKKTNKQDGVYQSENINFPLRFHNPYYSIFLLFVDIFWQRKLKASTDERGEGEKS